MVLKVKTLPLPGETILGGIFFMNAGGKGLTRQLQLQGWAAMLF